MLSFSSYSVPSSLLCRLDSSLLVDDLPLKPKWPSSSSSDLTSLDATSSKSKISTKKRRRTTISTFDRVVFTIGLVALFLLLRAFLSYETGQDLDKNLESRHIPSARFSIHLERLPASGKLRNIHEHHFVDADGLYDYSVECDEEHDAFVRGLGPEQSQRSRDAHMDE